VVKYTLVNKELSIKRQVRVRKLSDPEDDDLKARTTPAERIEMMWQLTQDAWTFKGEPIAQPGLHRHIIRVFRRER
jgi:hypothetical protein